jgi:hypothetical protein
MVDITSLNKKIRNIFLIYTMDNHKLLEIIEILKQKILQERNQYESKINNLIDTINNQNKEIQFYKYKLSEINNNVDNYSNYIDKIEQTCLIQNYEVERLQKEKEMKDILNKKKRVTNKKKNNKIKETQNNGFTIDKKFVSFD